MMLKERPPTTQPATPVHRRPESKTAETDATPPRAHTDYDLQPLRVSSLEHYVDATTDDLFHVH